MVACTGKGAGKFPGGRGISRRIRPNRDVPGKPDPASAPSGRPGTVCRGGRGSAGGQDHAASASAEGTRGAPAQARRGFAPGSARSARRTGTPPRRQGSPRMVQMRHGVCRGRQLPACQQSRHRNAPAWRFRLVPLQTVGRAVRQAQAAHHALVGKGPEIGIGGQLARVGHRLMLSFAAHCAGRKPGSCLACRVGVPISSRAFRRIQAHFRAPKVQL